jgi:hypothetical protein
VNREDMYVVRVIQPRRRAPSWAQRPPGAYSA